MASIWRNKDEFEFKRSDLVAIKELRKNNKLKSFTIKNRKVLNYACVKNYQFTYSLLKKYSWLETLLIHGIKSNVGKDGRNVGFEKIKNPYDYSFKPNYEDIIISKNSSNSSTAFLSPASIFSL